MMCCRRLLVVTLALFPVVALRHAEEESPSEVPADGGSQILLAKGIARNKDAAATSSSWHIGIPDGRIDGPTSALQIQYPTNT